MLTKSRSFLLAASLIAAPVAVAMAQSANETGKSGTSEAMGSHSGTTSNYGTKNRHKAGATGTGTVVPGSTSTLHGSSAGKSQQKQGTIGRQ